MIYTGFVPAPENSRKPSQSTGAITKWICAVTRNIVFEAQTNQLVSLPISELGFNVRPICHGGSHCAVART